MPSIINAIILAGGFGTRLNNSVSVPKGLIPAGSTTLLGRLLSDVHHTPGIHATTIVTNAKYHRQFQDYLDANFPSQPHTLINDGARDNSSRLGAIGDLILSLDQTQGFQTDTLVLPSDTFYDFKLQELLAFYHTHHSFTTVVRRMDPASIANRLGCAVMSADQITSFVEKPAIPPSDLAAIPFYIYPRRTLAQLSAYVDSGQSLDAPGSIIPWLLSKGETVRAMVVASTTIDVGTPSDLHTLAQAPL